MGEIVNLRAVRKRKARVAAGERAAENRVLFGRTRVERDTAAATAERAARHLDQHHRQDRSDEPA